MLELMSKLQSCLENGQDCVLVSIVRDGGSAPRGAGAQMLAGAAGRLCGSIGGGQVEHLALQHSALLLSERRCDRKDYVFRRTDGNTDMICGGDVTVLFTFVPGGSPAWREVTGAALARMEARLPALLLIPSDGSSPSLQTRDGSLLGGVPLSYGGMTNRADWDGRTFALPLEIPDRAVLFGGGHIALALSPLLQSLGFRVTVFDDRPEFVAQTRFPGAQALICGDYARVSDFIDIREEDYVLVMTNGHAGDTVLQKQLLRGRLAYVGVVGSRRKKAAVEQKLRDAGISEERIASVHTPVGLAIGAVTPAEIAVSIAAEMIRVRADLRSAGEAEA